MRIAGLQLEIAWEDPEESFRRAAALAEKAADDGARLLALPEAFATGFSAHSAGMAVHADSIRTFLANLARRLGVWVVGGYIEPGEERPVNACSLMAPDGTEALHCR